jgi:hypothetical protein
MLAEANGNELRVGRLRAAFAEGRLGDAGAELQAWLKAGLVSDFIAQQIERLITSSDYIPTMSVPYVRMDGLLIAVALAIPGSVPLFGKILRDSAEDAVIGIAGGAAMTFRINELPNLPDHDVFDRSVRLSPGRVRTLHPLEVLEIRAGRDVVDVVEHEGYTVLVSAHGPPRYTTVWTFDSETLVPKAARAATLQISRIEFALGLLAHFGSPTSAVAIEPLLSHEAHNVRWCAANALDRIAPQRTADVLRRLCDDEHPHVRAAAKRALAARMA